MSHIKLDRVNWSILRFGGLIRKFKKNESFFAENARFFEYNLGIWVLKIGDNLI